MPRRRGNREGQREKRGDEEIMGVAVGWTVVRRWSLHGSEMEGATSIIPHSGKGQNQGTWSKPLLGFGLGFSHLSFSTSIYY